MRYLFNNKLCLDYNNVSHSYRFPYEIGGLNNVREIFFRIMPVDVLYVAESDSFNVEYCDIVFVFDSVGVSLGLFKYTLVEGYKDLSIPRVKKYGSERKTQFY